MKLYQIIKDDEVLEKVMEMVERAQNHLLVSAGEEDYHQVQPDSRYYSALNKFNACGGRITRYYFGSKDKFEIAVKENPAVKYVYGGRMELYQRAVIADGKYAMTKIGSIFVYSENPLWVKMLGTYFTKLHQDIDCPLAVQSN